MIAESTFRAAWWLPGGHAQTLWASLVRRPVQVETKRERVELADGDFIDLDWTTNTTGPIVLVLHGLQGSSNSRYARGIMAATHAMGWRCVVMHFRGRSGEPNRLARAYHSGETTDLQYIVDIMKQREPGIPIAAIGYSLGGNVLLKWLGETSSTGLVAAAAVSVPYDLKNGTSKLNQGFSRIYQRHLLNSLKRDTARKESLLTGLIDFARSQALQTIYEFDDIVTAPLHNFTSADEYYTLSSCRQFLDKITLPTLLLHAVNDPFMTRDAIPAVDDLAKNVTLELSEEGGHVGFVSGKWPWKAEYWLEKRLVNFIKDYF